MSDNPLAKYASRRCRDRRYDATEYAKEARRMRKAGIPFKRDQSRKGFALPGRPTVEARMAQYAKDPRWVQVTEAAEAKREEEE